MAQHAPTAPTAPTDPAEAIVAAIGRLGQATPADIAAEAGVAYSTTTRKLRELAAAGRAEKLTTDNRTLWRLPNPDRVEATDPDRPDTEAAPTDDPGTDNLGTDVGAAPAGVPDEKEPAAKPTVATPATAAAEATDPAQPVGPAQPVEPPARVDERATDTHDQAEQPAGTGQPADAASASPAHTDGATADAAPNPPEEPAAPAKPRRASGTLDGAVLDILEAHPDRGFKVSELCKLIDAANAGTDTAKASPGAVVLAAQRLVGKGKAVLAVERPATFQLAATGG